jgi:hypothetical protein
MPPDTHTTATSPDLRVETVGPGLDDWAVVDQAGEEIWRGPAHLAERAAEQLRRLLSDH